MFILTNNTVQKLWSISLLFYLFRTVFFPLKYAFILFFGLLIILFLNNNYKHFLKKENLKYISTIKEFLTVFFLYILGVYLSKNTNTLIFKEIINFSIITVFLITYINIYEFVSIKKLIKLWILVSLLISFLGLTKWLLVSFYPDLIINKLPLDLQATNSSLSRDYNYYAFYIIISIIIFKYNLVKNYFKINIIVELLIYFSYIINILLSHSRRGLVSLIIIEIVSIIFLFVKRKNLTTKSYNSFKYILILQLIIITIISLVISFRIYIFQNKKSQNIFLNITYRYMSILKPKSNAKEIKKDLWEDYSLYEKDKSNLIYNGNFNYATQFWKYIIPDTINHKVTHKIIDSKLGNVLRISREKGSGYFTLAYNGRIIHYYKDITYTLKFNFRIIKGDKVPFHVGWWVDDGGKRPINLNKIIKPVDNSWQECQCSYTFKNDHDTVPMFLNSQKAGTIIDITNIQLTCNDTLNRPMYADEIYKIKTHEKSNRLLGPRTMRWKYALELFNNYPLINKIFGNGFDYLYLFAEKFPDPSNPTKKTDYPHNPILSALLYSGIIGALYYIYFLILVFWYYWKYRKYHSLFFILYLVTFFFTFVSGNSHFSVPIFAMLSVVPFITKYLIKTGKINQLVDK